MSKAIYSVGDIVKLKSGGPVMTIHSVNDTFTGEKVEYTCKWFSGSKLQNGTFEERAIDSVEQNDE